MTEEYHKYMLKAEEKNNLMFVFSGNALKRKADEKADQMTQIKKRLVELEEKKTLRLCS